MTDVRRLPTPVTAEWDWQMRGACRGMDTELFFHPDNERGPARARRDARAKDICRGCPVLDECRRHSLLVQEPYGIWGGLSASERDAIIHGRRHRAEHIIPAQRRPGHIVSIEFPHSVFVGTPVQPEPPREPGPPAA